MGRLAVLFDEDCGFCRWSADRLRSWDRSGRMRFVAIQSEEGARLLGSVPPRSRLDAMHAVTPDGRVWTGGDAVPRILEALPGGRPLALPAAAAPGLARLLYRVVAARRDRFGALLGQRACSVDPARDA